MWVRFIKSHTRPGKKKKERGRVVRVINSYGRELINKKIAEEYKEGLPVKKMRSDIFKPKNEIK